MITILLLAYISLKEILSVDLYVIISIYYIILMTLNVIMLTFHVITVTVQ